MSQQAITVEKWAELLAHQQHFGPGNENEVLRRFRVSEGAFVAASMEWSTTLGKAAGTANDAIVNSFATAFKETTERLAREQPAIESIGPSKAQWLVDETSAHVPSLSSADLPFGKIMSPAFVAALASRESEVPVADVGVTLLPGVLVDAHQTLPFSSSIAQQVRAEIATKLTIEQYASLSAELAVYPQRGDSVRQRYGFRDPEDQRKEDEDWAVLFRLDPALARQWQALVEQYQAWFRNPR